MKSTILSARCPDSSRLTQYVSGVLETEDADSLALHLDGCSSCQRRVDELTHRKDSLIDAVRRSSEAVSVSDHSDLAGLLEKAEQLRGSTIRPSRTGPVRTLSLKEFVACLRKSGLMNPSEVDLYLEKLEYSESSGLAQELITRNKLTPYQANALLKGFWKGFFLGNYIILEKLAHGGMSTVFKARHRRMGRVVCLKVPHTAKDSPHIVERFRREAKTVAVLKHPNIVVAHDADEDGQIPFLVMEFVEGSDLAKLVTKQGPLPVEKTIDILLQVAKALEYVHDQGVIHRDIKPHNLLMDASGTVKILDMGLARFDSYLARNADATTHASITSSGVIMGTIDYMSPEQALNCKLADHRSDIYSLGCTLFFLLTGKPLFAGETLMEKLISHREKPAPDLTSVTGKVSAGLNAVFRHMVEKEPEARYQSMTDVVRDLDIIRNGSAELLSCQDRVRSKWFLRVAGLVIGIVVLLVAAGIPNGMWFPSGTAPSPKPKSLANAPKKKIEPIIVGHPKTLANKGPGRALLVVPHDWFIEEQYQAIDSALKKQGIDIAVASSKPGTAIPKHGKINPVTVDLLLDPFDADDFDAVIFVGGNVYEFMHKNPKTGELARRVMNTCLDKGLIVAAIADGVNVLNDAGINKACNYSKANHCLVGTIKGRPGRIVHIQETKYAPQFTDIVFGAGGLRETILSKNQKGKSP